MVTMDSKSLTISSILFFREFDAFLRPLQSHSVAVAIVVRPREGNRDPSAFVRDLMNDRSSPRHEMLVVNRVDRHLRFRDVIDLLDNPFQFLFRLFHLRFFPHDRDRFLVHVSVGRESDPGPRGVSDFF